MSTTPPQTTASIIIPCYNNGNYIADAIESALSQTHPSTEVIVVDDGSTDDSALTINQYRKQITFIQQSNSGACAARNVGLTNSTGKWVKFLDGDDILNPDCIETQIEMATRRNVVIFGDCELINRNGKIEPHASHHESSQLSKGNLATLHTFLNSPVLISTTLYPRSVFQQFGGFNLDVLRGQEHELNLRLYLNGVNYEYHPFLCFKYRQHDSPTRISVSSRRQGYFQHFHNFKRLIELAETGSRRDNASVNRTILAKAAWRTGRRRLRYDERAEAADFFTEAIRLGGRDSIYGSRIYSLIAQATNPFLAERASAIANRIRGRQVEIDK
jgi:glycosyltransferase involved in cell wall biosynthesis